MNDDDQDDDLDQIQHKYGIEIIQRYSHPFKNNPFHSLSNYIISNLSWNSQNNYLRDNIICLTPVMNKLI